MNATRLSIVATTVFAMCILALSVTVVVANVERGKASHVFVDVNPTEANPPKRSKPKRTAPDWVRSNSYVWVVFEGKVVRGRVRGWPRNWGGGLFGVDVTSPEMRERHPNVSWLYDVNDMYQTQEEAEAAMLRDQAYPLT